MLPYRESRLAKMTISIFFLCLLIYAYFEARAVLYGPQIQIPTDVLVVAEPYTEVRGQASYISELRLNGAVVHVTEDGRFVEELLLAPGENRIVFDAKDTFGRSTQKVVKVYYRPTNDSSPPSIVAPEVGSTTTNISTE